MKRFSVFLASILLFARLGFALGFAEEAPKEEGWPREITQQGAQLVYYQPQVDDWRNFKDLEFRLAVELTPKGGQPAVGVLEIHAQTTLNVDQRTVLIDNMSVTQTHFPSLSGDAAAKMDQLVKSFIPPDRSVVVSMDRFIALAKKPEQGTGVAVENQAPPIRVAYGPAILLQLDGPAVWGNIPNSSLQFLVNTNWPVFQDSAESKYYLFDEKEWLVASSLEGPWSYTDRLPEALQSLAKDPQWAALEKAFPPPAKSDTLPKVFYATKPTEVIMFRGQPSFADIPGTNLAYATNTDSDVFRYSPSKEYFFLVAGRWFRAPQIEGPWTFSTPDLPSDFAQIPPDSPASRVLASIPGTEEAKDAVLLAQVPTTAEINPAKAEAQANVAYSGGQAEFKPIEGTSLSYATNTTDKVIKVGDQYYLCEQGLWFSAGTPTGPWKTATSVPNEIYAIPPSSPVYNVTYVTQTAQPNGDIQASYTAGYFGTFIVGMATGAILASGTGHYYPPYFAYPAGGIPVYRPYPATYGVGAFTNPYVGAYGVSRSVYGPQGSVTSGTTYNPYTGTYSRSGTAYGPYGSASAGRAYNPYTGTFARGATATTNYGTASAAQAYNPRTGNYAAARTGSNPYGQWGSSVVHGGNQTVTTQRATTAQGSASAMQSSSGGRAVTATGAGGNSAAVRTPSGDMYAGKDGNVYRNTNGSWQKYSNGSWAPANTSATTPAQRPTTATRTPSQLPPTASRPSTTTGPSSAGAANRPAGTSQASRSFAQNAPNPALTQDYANRQRGEQASRRFQQSSAPNFQSAGATRGRAAAGGVQRGGGLRAQR